MADQLEKSLSVDLSQLDAQLKQEQVLWRSIEEGSEQTEKKLQRQRREMSTLDAQLRNLTNRGERLTGRGRRLTKSVLQDVVSVGLSEIPGVGSGITGRIGNLAADAAFGGLTAGALTFAGLLTLYSELKRVIEIGRERTKEVEKMVYDQKMAQIVQWEQIRKKIEKEEADRLDFMSKLEAQTRFNTAELLYQSSQYLDQ